jgi:hypothetical protein
VKSKAGFGIIRWMKKETKKQQDLILYTDKKGNIELRADIKKETIWATQMQIAGIFGIERSVVTKHINNLFKDKELDQKSNVQKMHIPNSDKPVIFYNLDIILSIGYRTNSVKAIKFRQWATKTLKAYLQKGYVLNKKTILKNYNQFIKNVESIQTLLPAHITLDPKQILDLVKEYALTWSKLDQYDRDNLSQKGQTKKKVNLQSRELLSAISDLKKELIKKGEATDIFAHERQTGNIEGIIGNVMQSFGGLDVYKTLEEKSAHLLYFIVKNHPFTDGNKRSGAFAFIWFLKKFIPQSAKQINPSGLTALTLLIAESDPTHKEKMVALVVELLKRK